MSSGSCSRATDTDTDTHYNRALHNTTATPLYTAAHPFLLRTTWPGPNCTCPFHRLVFFSLTFSFSSLFVFK